MSSEINKQNHDLENNGSLQRRDEQNDLIFALEAGKTPQTLPTSRQLTKEARQTIDLDEGINPAAINKAHQNKKKSISDIMILLSAVAITVLALKLFFPWKRIIREELISLTELELVQLDEKDIKKLGGLNKLLPLQKTIWEVSNSYNKGELKEAKIKCEEALAKLTDIEEKREWAPIWKNYLKILYELQDYEKLLLVCDDLKKLSPALDLKEAVLFENKVNLEQLIGKLKLKKKARQQRDQDLKKLINDCIIAKNSLNKKIEKNKADEILINEFNKLLIDAYFFNWNINKFSWETDDLKNIFKYLNELPENSVEQNEKRLNILRCCANNWKRNWYGTKKKFIIENRTMTYQELLTKITDIENTLNAAR